MFCVVILWCIKEHRTFISSFDVQEDYNARDVIDDTLFPLPPLEGRTHQVLCSALCILLQEERIHNVCYVLVLKELPDAITRQNNYLVFWR